MDTKEYRQVVSDKSITSSKSFNDYLYGWLVLKAQEENGERFVMKRSFVFSKMEKELGMTRKTLAKYFEYFVEVGLVVDGGDKWILIDLGNKGFWIETEILERLIETKKRYAISAYVYLRKGRWLLAQKGKEKVPITLGQVKEYLGITNNSKGNNYIITDLFEEYRVLGLLRYDLVKGREGNRQFYVLSGVGQDYYF
jgi:hypothetical protein